MVSQGKIVYTSNTVYLVYLGAGIKESVATGFNMYTDYFGYHASGLAYKSQKFYYATVGLPKGYLACIPIAIQKLSLNDPALDGSLSTIVHEIAELLIILTRMHGKTLFIKEWRTSAMY
jgi:hypothetical protein